MTEPFETLDPQDWEEMRALAHQMVDDALDYLATVADRPVWQPVPAAIADTFTAPAPQRPGHPADVYQTFKETILPYPMGTIHPRFWGWYMGNGTVTGALADFLAAIMNPNLGGGNHVANMVEGQVVNWIKAMVGFPPESSGLLLSGGSMANLLGLAVARNEQAGFPVRAEGMLAATAPLVVYASVETHSSVQKAVELLGLGSENLRYVATHSDYRVDLTALRSAIAADRAAGRRPIAIVGNAGTINTGAIDDLAALADLSVEENLWFHVDGAIGAVAILAHSVRPLLAGMERADSLALDLHKWLHVPFEAGCVLVKRPDAHRAAFSLTPAYLEHATRGLNAGRYWFSDYGLQLSRGFRALKVWFSIKEHGLERFGRLIDRNVAQAHYLAILIRRTPNLELTAPVGLDIVCFRFNPGNLDGEQLNALNKAILTELQEQGIAAPSSTTLSGRFCLRVAIANYRSRQSDFDALIAAVVSLAQTLHHPN